MPDEQKLEALAGLSEAGALGVPSSSAAGVRVRRRNPEPTRLGRKTRGALGGERERDLS